MATHPLSSIKHTIELSQSAEFPHHLDLYLTNLKTLEEYDAIECSCFVYPQSRKLDADSFQLLPFEEYVLDVAEGQRSSYQADPDATDKVFGVMLAIGIFAFLSTLHGKVEISLESTVSVLGAYAIGKELWQDIDSGLIELTKNLPLRWHEHEYFYTRQSFGTMQRFSQIGRKNKYGEFSALPSKLDFISHSNSKTVEMLFYRSDFTHVQTTKLRVLTIELSPEFSSEFIKSGYLITVKLSLMKKFAGLTKTTELYQAVHNTQTGAVDEHNSWQKHATLARKAWSWGKLTTHRKAEILPNFPLMDIAEVK